MNVPGPVVLRPVNSTPPRIHGPARPTNAGLNDVLTIEKIVIVIGLVLSQPNPTADFRHHLESDKIRFRVRGFCRWYPAVRRRPCQRKVLDKPSRCCLDKPLLKEERILFRLTDGVCWNRSAIKFSLDTHKHSLVRH